MLEFKILAIAIFKVSLLLQLHTARVTTSDISPTDSSSFYYYDKDKAIAINLNIPPKTVEIGKKLFILLRDLCFSNTWRRR